MDGLGSDGHRADGLLVAFVANINNLVALAGAHFDLVMDLGDKWANRIDHVPAGIDRCGDHFGRRAVRGQHDWGASGNFGNIVDEDDPHVFESLNDKAVVNNLVIAVNGRLERANHRCKGLDGHLDASTETSGCSE